jgi:H+/Cl- antiporter ClcA
MSVHEQQRLLNDVQIGYDMGADSYNSDDNSRASSPPPPPSSKNSGYSQGAISLDTERVVNEYSIQACRDRMLHLTSPAGMGSFIGGRAASKRQVQNRIPSNSLVGHAGRSATRWALTAIAGILTGLTTVFIVSISEKLISIRARRLDAMLTDPNDPNILVFLRFSLFSWLLAFTSSLLCVAWVPAAAGSGIPEVKAYLNGVRVKRFSSFSLFFVKIVGTILSVASSLAVGKEGPLIHIGAIVGAGCSKLSIILSHLLATPFTSGFVSPSENGTSFLARLWLWTTSDLAYFANDIEKRDLVTIGAAVGFAASFGAPIGGLLFVLDDISTFFDKSMSLRVLVANALGTFCLAIYRGDLSQYSVISLVRIRTWPPSAQ